VRYKSSGPPCSNSQQTAITYSFLRPVRAVQTSLTSSSSSVKTNIDTDASYLDAHSRCNVTLVLNVELLTCETRKINTDISALGNIQKFEIRFNAPCRRK